MAKYDPVSTYRLQFNKDFTLNDAQKIIPYLYKSGIKTIYASPVFKAVAGSAHGYDVTDPQQINPEIGTNEDFENLVNLVHEKGMGWLQDIVPNHMAYSTENPWMYDVLEKGKNSRFYRYFDIRQDHPDENLKYRIMLPFFGKPLKQMLRDKELQVVFNKGGFKLKYFENEYPMSLRSLEPLLRPIGKKQIPRNIINYLEEKWFSENPSGTQKMLYNDYQNVPAVKNYIDRRLVEVNEDNDQLKMLVDLQHYYPSFWRDTETKINYRRFFTINGLICVNVQKQYVFAASHELIKKWSEQQLVDGLRIDHIDGLYNPAEYLGRLRELVGNDMYISVEKILEKGESLPLKWPIDGSTGYDFLSLVNNLLTNPERGPEFYSYYIDWIDNIDDFTDVFYRKSRFILYKRLKGELENLTRECMNLPSIKSQNFSEEEIETAIAEFLILCPVYKIYGSPSNFLKSELQDVKDIINAAMKRNKENGAALKALLGLFMLKKEEEKEEPEPIDTFFRHCMQFTGPLMAKGIEDTAFYSYNPFICHNEVGDSPAYFGITPETFHMSMHERHEKFPLTMNAISTHDTKRGEDARARLNVLSDLPDDWITVSREWRQINRQYKKFKDGKEIPSANDEYFIYQVLCAHVPMNGQPDDLFIERFRNYLVKALREAKENTSWSNPDKDYEQATARFVEKILSPKSEFTGNFISFLEKIIPHGIVNSITQVILKNTAPGIPDTFQGTENWNLSFVDPDNRRPVDYEALSAQLDELTEAWQTDAAILAKNLWENPVDPKIKHWAHWLTLQERRQFEVLFQEGSYIPLKTAGKYKKNVMAFYRNYFHDYMIVAVPINTATLPDGFNWEDTQIKLPGFQPTAMENRLTKNAITVGENLNVSDIFNVVPFAVLRSLPEEK